MRIEPVRKLFAGIRIDNKLRDAMGSSPPRDRQYFDGSDPRYLLVVRAAEDSYVGKVFDPGTTASSMEDLKRHILSVLNRLAGGRRNEDDVKIFALDDGEPPPMVPKEPSQYERDRGGY